ncbi:MAG: fructokinase [Mycobacterium sp.]|jgi:fructokinase|nr:fructokinase [Mycobacterium sp.]
MSDNALVVGEALIDVVMRDGRTLGEHVGGSPLNVAVGLARLDRSVDFLTWIGDDERGRRISEHLRASGARLADGSVEAARTATALATLDESGSATYMFDIEWRLSERAFAVTREPCVVHTGSIASVLEPGCATVAAIVDAYSPISTITYDPNIRPPLIDDPNAARARVEAMVARADVVKASDEDLRWLEPGTPPEQIAEQWLAMGPAIVAVTRGADGAFAVCAAGEQRIPARRVEVVDTVGAGDAFMAGLIDALWDGDLLGGNRRDDLYGISYDTLGDVLGLAALSSALTVARPGADLPDRATRDAALQVAPKRKPVL